MLIVNSVAYVMPIRGLISTPGLYGSDPVLNFSDKTNGFTKPSASSSAFEVRVAVTSIVYSESGTSLLSVVGISVMKVFDLSDSAV